MDKTKIIIVSSVIAVAFAFLIGTSDPKTGAPEPVIIAGETITFAYADDNTGEDLAIYLDKDTYTDGLSHAEVKLAVVNESSVSQSVEIAAYFTGSDKRIGQVHVGNVQTDTIEDVTYEEVCVEDRKRATTTCSYVVTGTTTRQETKNVWRELATTERSPAEKTKETTWIAKEARSRKLAEGFEAERKSQGQVIAPGEVAYFKFLIHFPRNQRDEFYFEAIGSEGGYGHLR
jgi:hypothetical protein